MKWLFIYLRWCCRTEKEAKGLKVTFKTHSIFIKVVSVRKKRKKSPFHCRFHFGCWHSLSYFFPHSKVKIKNDSVRDHYLINCNMNFFLLYLLGWWGQNGDENTKPIMYFPLIDLFGVFGSDCYDLSFLFLLHQLLLC